MFVGIFCQEAVVKDVLSDSSWNGVSCTAQARPSRPSCQELHVSLLCVLHARVHSSVKQLHAWSSIVGCIQMVTSKWVILALLRMYTVLATSDKVIPRGSNCRTNGWQWRV